MNTYLLSDYWDEGSCIVTLKRHMSLGVRGFLKQCMVAFIKCQLIIANGKLFILLNLPCFMFSPSFVHTAHNAEFPKCNLFCISPTD